MADDISKALAAASAATTGPDTPEAISATQKPDSRLVWALIGAGMALSVMIAVIVWLLAFRPWPVTSAPAVIQALAWIAYGLLFCLAIVVFRLADAKRIEAKAGPVSAVVDA